jgi:hypothetical protein
METVYFVAAYSHSENQWARYLVTAMTADGARLAVADQIEPSYRIRSAQPICMTPDYVFTEI